jgi:hypothetical protein
MTVDPDTPTLDCVSCIEAKHTVKPFSLKSENMCKRKGELMHIVTHLGGQEGA